MKTGPPSKPSVGTAFNMKYGPRKVIHIKSVPPAPFVILNETRYVHGRRNPRPIPRSGLEFRIRVRDSYLGLVIRIYIFWVMDATSKFLGLG